jgi:hypothetical protein
MNLVRKRTKCDDELVDEVVGAIMMALANKVLGDSGCCNPKPVKAEVERRNVPIMRPEGGRREMKEYIEEEPQAERQHRPLN